MHSLGKNEPVCSGLELVLNHFAVLRTQLCHQRPQPTHAQQVVGSCNDVGMQLYPRKATQHGAAQPSIALHPAKYFFDPLTLALADRITGVARGAPVEQPRHLAILDLRDVWRDPVLTQMFDKIAVVIALVGAESARLHALLPLSLQQVSGSYR